MLKIIDISLNMQQKHLCFQIKNVIHTTQFQSILLFKVLFVVRPGTL